MSANLNYYSTSSDRVDWDMTQAPSTLTTGSGILAQIDSVNQSTYSTLTYNDLERLMSGIVNYQPYNPTKTEIKEAPEFLPLITFKRD